MAVLDQLLFVLLTLLPNEPHGGQNGCFSLVGRESGQPLLGRQLDIHTEPIGQKAQLTDKLGACTGNGLGVDIAVEAVLLPQKAQSLDHALGGVVRIAQDAAGEKKTFNIIAAVELDGSASSLGVKAVRRVSLLRRLTQYLQSYTQQLVMSTFSREIQRPSAEKLWQQPATEEDVLPILPV